VLADADDTRRRERCGNGPCGASSDRKTTEEIEQDSDACCDGDIDGDPSNRGVMY
jgi:hypothetical protein